MSGKGKIYIGSTYKFKLGKCIGRGGNGKVYEADFLRDQCDKKCVVKILDMKKWKDEKIRKLRYKRFCKEIYTVKKLQNSISGLMKILDFYCSDKM